MPTVDSLQFILIPLAVSGVAWIGVRTQQIKRMLALVLMAALAAAVIMSLEKLWPTRFVAEDLLAGNTRLYITWNIKYFFIDFIPALITLCILTVSASTIAWTVHVRFGKAKWVGILSGLLVALVLFAPAIVAGVGALITVIPGSWP
ncbi:MAG: hypothetical protein HY372_01740 [Candidatus Andersenbacteria bacterium]|nr:hypothetical protein [Candidatus Andersenbacteria bacterium]